DRKVVEWYGDKESAMEAGTNPKNPEIFSAYQNRMEQIMKRLAEKKGTDVSSFEVKSLMGEYDFVAKQLYQMKDVSKMALELAELYRKEEQMIHAQDAQYGEGRAPVLQRRSVYFTRRKYQENRGFL
ncbi:MAG: MerR family transcriptional regulator, partial [Lachnospiraceae bacterium]|nr:MerR family transcriptional regulator [Lachnospiraceae bacterium]